MTKHSIKCGKCLCIKQLSEFYKNHTKKRGVQSYCKKCICAYRRQYFKDNGKKFKDYRRKRVANLKDTLIEYKKANPCSKCGEGRWYVLHLHHKDPSIKIFSVSQFRKTTLSKKRMGEEIKKCEVLCANCHMEVHHEERTVS